MPNKLVAPSKNFAWNLEQIPLVVAKLRSNEHEISAGILSHITPLMWKHINPFGRCSINVDHKKRL